MKVTVYGAAHEVTGSCYLVETEKTRLLVDCGLFQGPKRLEKLNYIPTGLSARALHMVTLTHGHLDHCGRLPLLVKSGFRGPVFATAGTIDIATLVLRDAAKIQQDEANRENRRRHKTGAPLVQPLFTIDDVDLVCSLFQEVNYEKHLRLGKEISVCFRDAGHILGSACLEFTVSEADGRRVVVFSGDLGQWDVPILRDPERIGYADVVFMESTYGDRDHRSLNETTVEFESLVKAAIENSGKILVPTFAVGRAQQVLFHLADMFRRKIVEPIPVYLDSPMALAATAIYANHTNVMDSESQWLYTSGQLKRDLSSLIPCTTPEESTELNSINGPCLIMAGAGMCNAGRILHHLRHNLSNERTTVIIVGFQPRGSLGRNLLEGAEEVKIHGRIIPVKATIRGLGGFSAHAGQRDLLRWVEPMTPHKPRIFLTHGENGPIAELAKQIHRHFDIEAEAPSLGDSFLL